ncbi:MAG: hypothetical protein ACT4QC_08870 [Planctomycetaceae bacterium]
MTHALFPVTLTRLTDRIAPTAFAIIQPSFSTGPGYVVIRRWRNSILTADRRVSTVPIQILYESLNRLE